MDTGRVNAAWLKQNRKETRQKKKKIEELQKHFFVQLTHHACGRGFGSCYICLTGDRILQIFMEEAYQ